ncbi:hypothetical protein ACJIZ3_014538 [Penstemon smallii]|uniref:Peptidase A1 domain-containing protein n=1 Tax=Penstemon smallii TaxID=265156 RepID=A0ABD3RUH9_9LAMI
MVGKLIWSYFKFWFHINILYNFRRFPFQYSDTVLRQGLASSTQGVISLGRTRISLQAQLASEFKIREKFALCVPSSGHEGNLIIGNVAYNKPIEAISKSLISTPLIRNPVSSYANEVIGNLTLTYFINVKSIRVNNKTLSFNNSLLSIDESTGDGGTSLRTVRSYTSLHRSIYIPLVDEFNVFWRFYGSNSMVRVSKNVMCLAFVEEFIVGPATSITVGGYQMENYLLEFDLTSSMLRYNIRFPFQYSDPILRRGLASSSQGVISLGRIRTSLQAQLASSFKIREKFALCVPSSGHEGNLIIGNVAYNKPIEAISKSLISTPLIRNPVSSYGNDIIGNLTLTYFINVKSIRVNNKSVSFNNSLLSIDESTGDGGTCLRTVRSYTSLHRSIYIALVDEFVNAAASQGIKRVASVAPFGACFDAKTIASEKTVGPRVPIIDLVMNGKNVFWRFYGSNSMVRVSKNVICLAFVEGSPNLTGPTTSIVVGGYQMENYLLEFDLTSSKLRFSPSLLLSGTSCSQFGALL